MSRRRSRSRSGAGGTTYDVPSRRLPRAASLLDELVRPPAAYHSMFEGAAWEEQAEVPRVHVAPGLRSYPLFRANTRGLTSRRPRVFAPPPVPVQALTRFPRRAWWCVQRKVRREVLHALGNVGRAGTGRGPYRRREESNYRC